MSLLPSRPDASAPDDAEPRVIGVDSEDADDVLAALSSETARKLLSELHRDPAPPSELADVVDTSVQNVQYHLEKLETAGAIEVVDTAYSAKGREMDVYAPSDQPLVIFAGDESKKSTLRTALSRLLGAVGILAVASLAVQTLFGEGQTLPWFGDGASGESGGPATDGDGAGGTDDAAQGDGDGDAGGENGADGGNGNGAGDGSGDATTEETMGEDGMEAADADTATPEETPMPEQTPTPDITPEMTPTPEEIQTTAEAATGLPPGVLFFAGGVFALAIVAGVYYLR